MVDVRPVDGLVAVATHAHGIYTANITSKNDIATVEDLVPLVSELQMSVYPNPCIENATISFILPEDSHVQLKIFDENGKLVKQISNAQMQSGQHSFTFDAQNDHSGLYFCSLQAGNVVKTTRFIIVK